MLTGIPASLPTSKPSVILTERTHDVETKIAKAEDALFSGTVDEARFKSAMGRYHGELDGLVEEEARIRDDDRDFVALGVRLLELIKDVEKTFVAKSAYEQVEFLQILCSNISTDGVNISATYRRPFDVLVEGLEAENWLPGRHPLRNVPSSSGAPKCRIRAVSC